MGSDSRTATATSSKPRPKWRDRHLKQLNNEQLKEVSEHRGSNAAEIVGVEISHATTSQKPLEDKLPQRQAGPDRVRRSKASVRENTRDSQHDDTRKLSNKNSNQGNRGDVLQRHSEYQRSRQIEPHELGNRARQSLRDDDRSNNRNSDRNSNRQSRTRSERRPERRQDNRQERPQERSSQSRQSEQRPRRLDRQRQQDNRPVSRAEDAQTYRSGKNLDQRDPVKREVQPEADAAKKGLFAKLLKYKVQGPLKYGLIALAMAVMVAVSFMKPIDHSSQSQLDSALTRAMIGFGLARTLNGVISVAQGTEFAVQPAGVGVNFSPGEILDPINDLVERFSWVMLLATSSLGVQKILLEVSSWAGISMLLAGAALFFLLTRIRNSAMSSMADMAGKILLLMLLVRFLIPLGSLANDWVYQQFLEPHFEQSSAELELASERIKEISTRQTQTEEPAGSLKERAKKLYSSMTEKFDFDGMLNDYRDSAENVSEHAVNLIVVFLLQTIVFPLLFLYLIYRLFRSVVLPGRQAA